MLETTPRGGSGLIERVEKAGKHVRDLVQEELSAYYPPDPDGRLPLAYIWSRSVRCEAPNCGAEIPIYRSPWLSRRDSTRARYFKEASNGLCVALIVESSPLGGPVTHRIAKGLGSEGPRAGFIKLEGTKAPGNNANVICPCCDSVLSGNRRNPRVPAQLSDQNGGADVVFDNKGQRIGGARLLAVALPGQGGAGRSFRLPETRDYEAVYRAMTRLREELGARQDRRAGLLPNEPLPPIGTLGFRVQRYGMLNWGDL